MSHYHQIMRARLVREMHKTGCRLDDAAACADVALRELRAQRDTFIAAAYESGRSMRQIAKVFGVDVALVHRVLTRARSKSTATTSNLAPARPADAA
jgi:DNA-directed RNA polymerase specialized sigma24 family protein